jgi:DNA-binding SARP family transcriptional activator/tetratricopeptide (TPR) repeat protein
MKKPPASPGRFRVVLFGGPTVHRDSREVALSPYQRAAVGIVYGHGAAGLPRDRLIWLLWEADDAAQSRHGLSQLLYAVAGRLGRSTVLLTRGDQVLPNETAVQSDLCNLDLLTQSGRYVEAAKLIDAGFLTGLGSVSRELDDWRDARVLALRSKLRDAAAKAWADSEEAADWARARDAAEALLLLDPDSEPYLRCVMKARALTGAPEEAEAAFRGWVERCSISTHLDNASRCTALRADLGKWTAAAAKARSNAVADPPFVGRQPEARKLLGVIRSAKAGAITPILVSGEPGIGKTRLVAEICRLSELEGIPTLRARCGRLEQEIPLTPFADALRFPDIQAVVAKLDEPWRGVIRQILPELAPGPSANGENDPSVVSRRLFEGLRRLLMDLASEKVILWLDDFQWADHTTATALEYCRRRWDGGSLILILTFRVPSQQAATSVTYLIENCRAMESEVELEPFRDHETLALASSVLGHAIPEKKRSGFLALTDNIPLYTVELAHEVSQGRLILDEDSGGFKRLPIALQGIVDDRLSLLTHLERRVLEFIATADGLASSVLLTLVDSPKSGPMSEQMVVHALERLLSLRLIADEGGAPTCKHELIRQGVYDRTSPPRRALLHRQLATALQQSAPEKHLDEIALHFDKAHAGTEAHAFALRAALRASETGAYHEAIRFLQIARRHAPDRIEAAHLLSREAAIRYKQAEFEKAGPLLARAEQEWREVGRIKEGIASGIRGIHAACETGALDYTDSLTRLERFLADCENNQFWEQFVEGVECRLRILERQNRVDGMRPTIGRLQRVPQNGDVRVQCLAESVKALAIVFGESEGALDAANVAYKLAMDDRLADLRDKILHRLLFVHVYGGTMNVSGGRELMEEGLRRAARSDSLKTRYGFLEAAGLWHLESGEYPQAEVFFGQAEDVMRSAPEVSDKVQMFANRAEQFVMEGKLEPALDYYLKARAAMRPQHAWRAHQTVFGGLGYCALELGDLRLARDCEGLLEYLDEGYFDPTVIVLFKATVIRRRGDPGGSAEYVKSIANKLHGRLRMVVMKLRLLECRLRVAAGETEAARSLASWISDEATRLALPARLVEARALTRLSQEAAEVRSRHAGRGPASA